MLTTPGRDTRIFLLPDEYRNRERSRFQKSYKKVTKIFRRFWWLAVFFLLLHSKAIIYNYGKQIHYNLAYGNHHGILPETLRDNLS